MIRIEVPAENPAALGIMGEALLKMARAASGESVGVDTTITSEVTGGVVVSATDGEPVKDEKVEGAPATKAPISPTPKAPVEETVKPTETTEPEKVDDAPSVDPDTPLDSMGQPHDSRIHAKSKTKCDKVGKFGPGGIWKVSRGTDLKYIDKVRAQWIAKGYGPHLIAGAQSESDLVTPAAPAPAAPAAPAPAAEPKRRMLTPEERMTDDANHVSYQAFKDVVPPWSDEQLIAAGKMLAEADSWVEDTDGDDAPDGLDLTGANAFTTLIVKVCNPALESGLITQPVVDGIVSEVTGGIATALTLIPSTHMEEHIPEIVKRINATLES